VSQEHGTGELPASGLHDDTCKWLCPVPVGTPCVAQHSCSTCEFPFQTVSYCRCGRRLGAQDPGEACSTCKWMERKP
jgi:hypothetical protein